MFADALTTNIIFCFMCLFAPRRSPLSRWRSVNIKFCFVGPPLATFTLEIRRTIAALSFCGRESVSFSLSCIVSNVNVRCTARVNAPFDAALVFWCDTRTIVVNRQANIYACLYHPSHLPFFPNLTAPCPSRRARASEDRGSLFLVVLCCYFWNDGRVRPIRAKINFPSASMAHSHTHTLASVSVKHSWKPISSAYYY